MSQEDVSNFLHSIKLLILLGDVSTLESDRDISFCPFEWEDNKEKNASRAITHFQNELSKFSIYFGRGGFQIYDVHDKRTILNV